MAEVGPEPTAEPLAEPTAVPAVAPGAAPAPGAGVAALPRSAALEVERASEPLVHGAETSQHLRRTISAMLTYMRISFISRLKLFFTPVYH